MRGWEGRQGASDAGLRDARADADGREATSRCCVLRSDRDHRSEARQTEGRYTFGVADKPEMLEVYPHKTSFRVWAYTFPEYRAVSSVGRP